MEIELREIQSGEQFESAVLRDRVLNGKPPITRHYAAFADGKEVAFVAIDVPDDKAYLCIYELLVEPSLRGCGVGSAIVKKCCAFAVEQGCGRICVVPKPIESGGPEEKLIAWYTRLDFKPSSEQPGLLEILLP